MEDIQAVKKRFGIIGLSDQLNQALGTALRVANTDLTVLITGESGVGKEVFSKIIHALSPRKHNAFIAINCGAIPEGTINSELFGHEKGAFTGATGERKGYFETTDGGTIFLDEVGEMPLDTQAYLLRVLESGEFMRVGSSRLQHTDVRVIAATNVDLLDLVKKGKFREDLYYRINTVPINVPPLRKRTEDIYLLFRKFSFDVAEKYNTTAIELDEKARMLIENYSWPGNVRELKNLAEQVTVLCEKRQLDAEDLIAYMPDLLRRNLPMIPEAPEEEKGGFQEREILYKVLFDMRNDMNDLKRLLLEVIQQNDLRVPDTRQLKALTSPDLPSTRPGVVDLMKVSEPGPDPEERDYPGEGAPQEHRRPIIITKVDESAYDESEIVDENLSLEENEKVLIRKALRRHKGRRKEAANDLGISERTLYRKIKQYELS